MAARSGCLTPSVPRDVRRSFGLPARAPPRSIPPTLAQRWGPAAGQTDDKGVGRVGLAFRRKDKTVAWPEFEVTLSVPDEYKPVARRVE